jgi:hypothetical protein
VIWMTDRRCYMTFAQDHPTSFSAFKTGAETSVAGLPFRPKKVVSARCIFPSASPTADSVFVAVALALRGRFPAERLNQTALVRSAGLPVINIAEMDLYPRQSYSQPILNALTLPLTKRVRLASTSIVLSLLT